MHELKRAMAMFAIIVLLITFIVPAQAQFYGGPGALDSPQLSDDYQFTGDPMGTGPYGMSMPFMYPGMQDMPFMSPFMGMHGRQSEQVTPITRLPAPSGTGKDLMATLESVPQLSLFTTALKASGYDEKLKGQGNYLVFAPSDKAIMRDLSVKDVQSLVNDTSLVKGLVENCIVYQPAGQRQNKEKAFTSLNGKPIMLLRSKSGVTANGADVLNYFSAGNGLLIVTDGAVGT
jgi:uncharacterized surface protein with fasciclin (FAS1) repeats